MVPLPGLSHLKILHSAPARPKETLPPHSTAEEIQGTARQLTMIALETAFGIRPPQHLSRKRFDVGVRAHVTARRALPGPRGPVRLDSLHLRGEEIFGSATVAGQPHGFTASLTRLGRSHWRLRTFRVI
ncbi:hypothetical protein [Corynebacterium occultum]|nr:hypothetical protein [Corynebacterium occultum]